MESISKITKIQKINDKYVIDINSMIYNLDIKLSDDSITIKMKKQLMSVIYEGIFLFSEFSSISKIFLMYENIKEIFDSIIKKIESNDFELKDEKDNISLILLYTIDTMKKHVIVKIPKAEADVNEIISDLTTMVVDLSNRVKELEEFKRNEEAEKKKEEEKKLPFLKSSIIKTDEIDILTKWINKDSVKFELLYKGSVDGESASDFHRKCDNQGATVCLMETKTGYRFGGYASVSWDQSGSYKNDISSFLFSLNLKTKYKVSNPQHAIYCNSTYSCTFGSGHDIHIPNNYSTSSNSSNIPHAYGVNEVQKGIYPLTGSNTFQVRELEVYKIIN